jgi:hypothetical protein
MAQSWERTRPAALCPRWGVHGKKKKKEGGSWGLGSGARLLMGLRSQGSLGDKVRGIGVQV